MKIRRYALYFAPAPGGLMQAAAKWLGWDVEAGRRVPQPAIAGIEPATEAPRRYGFHATLKAPFRLADGARPDDLAEALRKAAPRIAPVELPGLSVATLGGSFLALRPEGGEADLGALCAEVVTGFERFRAPLTSEEVARRDPAGLTPRQRELMRTFGYPYVLDEFRFHMTLTGNLPTPELARFQAEAEAWFAPHLTRPFLVDQLCLCGEDETGRFHLLSRHKLGG